MPNNSAAKGNPASKRMMNTHKKAKRAESWARGQKRKQERVKAQTEREQMNKDLRALGLPTAWEEQKPKRRMVD